MLILAALLTSRNHEHSKANDAAIRARQRQYSRGRFRVRSAAADLSARLVFDFVQVLVVSFKQSP
jgi:hypothetical protein